VLSYFVGGNKVFNDHRDGAGCSVSDDVCPLVAVPPNVPFAGWPVKSFGVPEESSHTKSGGLANGKHKALMGF